MAKTDIITAERLRKTSDIRGLRLEKDAWIFAYRFAGKARRMLLGRAPGLIPADARKAAQHFCGLVAVGRDPATERRAARVNSKIAAAPVRDHVEMIAAQYLKWLRERVRPATFHETARVMAKEIMPKWAGKRLGEVTKSDVRKLVDGIMKRGSPVSANRCLTSIKAWLNWCVAEDILTASPAAGVRPPAIESARQRVLDDSELAAVWRASSGLGEFGAIVRLLVLTGQRRGEIAGLRWSEVDFEAKILNLPASRCKNGRSHQVPLSDAAIAIIESLPRNNGTALFETQSFSTMKGLVNSALKDEVSAPFTLHDLRRTFASGCARLGSRIEVVEKILNHASGSFRGIVGCYQRYNFAGEKKAALDLWADHVTALLAGPADTLTEAA